MVCSAFTNCSGKVNRVSPREHPHVTVRVHGDGRHKGRSEADQLVLYSLGLGLRATARSTEEITAWQVAHAVGCWKRSTTNNVTLTTKYYYLINSETRPRLQSMIGFSHLRVFWFLEGSTNGALELNRHPISSLSSCFKWFLGKQLRFIEQLITLLTFSRLF